MQTTTEKPNTELAKAPFNERQQLAQMEAAEKVLIVGDLSPILPAQRLDYYQRVCQSLGLNPLTRPFIFIKLNNEIKMYPTRDCSDQLRFNHQVNLKIISREINGDIYIVTAQATLPNGRTDESTGAVSIKGLSGDALANAYMKAETKAKRRVTLSLCGLGWADELEMSEVKQAKVVTIDMETGEILEPALSLEALHKRLMATLSQLGAKTHEQRLAGYHRRFPNAKETISGTNSLNDRRKSLMIESLDKAPEEWRTFFASLSAAESAPVVEAEVVSETSESEYDPFKLNCDVCHAEITQEQSDTSLSKHQQQLCEEHLIAAELAASDQAKAEKAS